MTRIRLLLCFALFATMFTSCIDETVDLFERPEWLKGRVFTIIQEQPELSTFAKAIELIGYDTIIDVSGNFTVFGPSNEAFDAYFATNPNYSSIEQMPLPELSRLIKYHLVQNPWSKLQLRSLDVEGWIDPLDLDNNKPRGFKRQTLLRDEDIKVGVRAIGSFSDRRLIVVDSLSSDWHRRITTGSRKYVPIFFQEYFDIYNLQSSDYEYYFGRPFEGADAIYYANAKIISDEKFAENGFVYIIDQVVEPLPNAYQLITRDEDDKYSEFLDLANYFPRFQYNEQRTEEQPGFDEGLLVDSLFDLTYPELEVNINSEITSPPSGTRGLPDEVTIRYHYGVTAPTNEALAQFEQEYFKINQGWGSLDEAPLHIKRIIARSHLINNPIYASDFENGYYNGEFDVVQLDPSTIIQNEYCSNSTFLGINKVIVPRVFTSIAGPVYLRRGYSKVMYAIEKSGLLSALKRPNANYMFFVPSDISTAIDSSFFYDSRLDRFTTIFRDGLDFKEYPLSIRDLRTLLLNHIAADQPRGIARKEFIPNLAGNFIIVNNETGEVTGTASTKDGYQGPVTDPDILNEISENADNGITYGINHWFDFSSTILSTYISISHNRFFKLLQKADLAGLYTLNNNFILNSEVYTVFIPSEAALDSARVDTLSKTDLKNLLMLHFIQGDMLFTDGNKNAGYYTTTRKNESSGNIRIYIEPGIDVIRLHDNNSALYVEVVESETSNTIAARNIGDGGENIRIPQLSTYAVVHTIDKVLMVDKLDTQ